MPTLLGGIYYGLIASDQFVVEVRFAVRSSSTAQSGDALSLFGAIPSANSTMTDSYIVIDYLQSRELVDKLDQRVGLRKIYSRPEVDYLSRFDNTLSVEEFVEYWRSMLKATFDVTSQVVAVDVRAFTAEDAKNVATALLELSEELINEISARARADAVRSSHQEVKRMEDLLAAAPFLGARAECNGEIGAVGFCFGGAIVNQMAVRFPDLDAAVPFYGRQPSAADTAKIKAPLLIHYAGEDQNVNAGWPAWKEALDKEGVKYREFTYPGTQHGFHNDTTPRYDEAAAKLAWSRTLAFFKENLEA